MHFEARQYVADQAAIHGPWRRVCEIGGRDINGGIRDLFVCERYVSVDIVDGPGVDVVADASTWRPRSRFDCCVSAECFEHTAVWPEIIVTAAHVLVSGGVLIVTAAGPGRGPHSGIDGGPVHEGEWYRNVEFDELVNVLLDAGFVDIEVNVLGPDVRAVAKKGRGR